MTTFHNHLHWRNNGQDEFPATEAEQMIPTSSWLRYWRALCYLHHNEPAKAIEDLEWALEAELPLNRPKREHAMKLLSELKSKQHNT